MIAEADYDALLGDLYTGVSEPDRLQAFLDGLGAASGSHITVMIREDQSRPQNNLVLARDGVPALVAGYGAEADAPDDRIWFQRSAHVMRTGAVFSGEEWATAQEVRRTRYYDEVLRHMGTLHSAAICGLARPGQGMFLTPCRSGRAGPYGAAEMTLFKRVARHWANACLLKVRYEALQAQHAAPGRRRHGLFLLDAHLRWVGGNEAAERMVAAGWLSGRRGARLAGCSALTEAAWTALQGRLSHPGERLQARIFPVYDATGALRAFASLQVYGAAAVDGELPGYSLFVRPLYMDNDADMLVQLRMLFDLTVGEARLALALRQHGDLHQAAGTLGLTDQSARTRLQVVYEKTGSHKQAGLLRMLDALAETIA